MGALQQLNQRIVVCERCPRLRRYCQHIATVKRASYRDWTYWGRPVPSLLPSADEPPEAARLLIVGLAPAAHGANRTGRMFTGDRSGDFLFRGLHDAGYANRPHASHVGDGFELRGVVITSAVHCAPPDNKPNRDELAACSEYLATTLDALPNLRVVLSLGGVGHAAVVREYRRRGWIRRRGGYKFGHGASHSPDDPAAPRLMCCYHPSQQNTFTGRLTAEMLLAVLRDARRVAEAEAEAEAGVGGGG